MPTTHPRYQVTVTPDMQWALDVAAAKWPDLPTSRQLVLLMEAGARAIETTEEKADEERRARHRERVLAGAGKYPGVFKPDHLDRVREGWRV